MVSVRRILLVGLLSISLTLAALPATPHVSAATFEIPAGDVTALIAAINQANDLPDPDEIVLTENATYTLTGPDHEENGLPAISSEITITGNGATITRSAASGTDVFRILHVVSGGTLTLNDVTVTNGEASFGGGILNEAGVVILTGSTVSDNSAVVSGGGTYNDSGTMTLIDSTITENSASAEGGGMYNIEGALMLSGSSVSSNNSDNSGGGLYSQAGTLLLTTSTIRGNTAYFGAGISGNSATLTLTDSTVSNNTAFNDGGGISNASGTVTVTNSTISTNSATFGGGIHNNSGTAILTNSTVSDNTANIVGGGIYSSSGTLTLANSIAAGNAAPVFPDISGAAAAGSGHNLIGNGWGLTGLTDGTNGNQVGTIASPIDPLLGNLDDNSGPTQTMELLEGSPAIDAGNDATAPEADQRGIIRPQGLASDIGAFELEAPDETPPVITPNVSGTLGNNGWYTTDVHVSWTVEDPDSPVTSTDNCEATDITTDTAGTTLTCTAISAGGENSQSVTIKRDATDPVITYSGNMGSFGPTDTINITCEATDATSGVFSDTCQDITSSTMSFGPGVFTFSATAIDDAGNTGSGSTSFTIGATYDDLCQLTREVVRQPSVSRSACSVLALAELADVSGNVMLEQLALLNYEVQIRSAMGRRYVSAADGAMLIAWARSM